MPKSTLAAYCSGKYTIPHEVRDQLTHLLGCDSEALQCIPRNEEQEQSPFPLDDSIFPSPSTTWFTLKWQTIQWIIQQWSGRATFCIELQKMLDLELNMFDVVRWLMPASDYHASRRQVLRSLALLPLTFSGLAQLLLPRKHPEELLPACAGSIAACWRLLNDSDAFATIDQALSSYVPLLISWSRSVSRYQQCAASLAAQGCLLLDLVCYHHFQFAQSVAYANQAVELARIAKDPDLLGYSLLLAGGAENLLKQPQTMLLRHQESAFALPQLLQPLQSYVLAQLAFSYAQNGQVQEALHTLGDAQQTFPTTFGEVPVFVAADYDQSQLILFSGLTHLALAETDSDHAPEHARQAGIALADIETFSPEVSIPARLQCEISQLRTQAAILTGDFDQSLHFFRESYQGALPLGSKKRWQELRENVRRAQQFWAHEKGIREIADLVQHYQ